MIKLSTVSILIFILAIMGIIIISYLLKKDKMHLITGFFWIGLLLTIGFFALFPYILDYIAHLVMVKNRIFFLLLTAILILFGLQLKQTITTANLEKKINKIIQENAINEFRLKQLELKIHTKSKK